MARGRAMDLVIRNKTIQLHQSGISQLQISQKLYLAQSTVCGIIKRSTTTGKNCPEKALCRKLRLTDREVRLFRRYISKNMHLAVAVGKTKLWKNHS